MNIPTITRNNQESHLEVIWAALQSHRENCIPEGTREYDEEWEELCTAMAWVREDLGIADEVEPTSFKFNIACNVRAYGYVSITAPNLESAMEKLTAAYVADHFQPHGSGSDDYDYKHPTEIWCEVAENEQTGKEYEIHADVAPGLWEAEGGEE